MNKYILSFLLFCVSLNLIAADSTQQFYDLKKKYSSEKNELKKPKKNDPNNWFFIYYSLGKSVDKINNLKLSSTSSSFGYKKVSGTFIQGYEYQILSNKEKFKAENYKVTLGYKPREFFKYSPYIEYQFGVSNYKDKLISEDTFGYVNAIELGFFVKRFLPLHLIGGTKFSFYSYDKDIVDSICSQEIFFRIGFEL